MVTPRVLDDEGDYIMQFRRLFGFPRTRLYSFSIFEHILLMLHRFFNIWAKKAKRPVLTIPGTVTWSVRAMAVSGQ